MKITEVDLFVLDVPPFAPMARIRPNIFTLGIVRMGTDEGLVGLRRTRNRARTVDPAGRRLQHSAPWSVAR